jgi:hypothetical protein
MEKIKTRTGKGPEISKRQVVNLSIFTEATSPRERSVERLITDQDSIYLLIKEHLIIY